jgi:PhoPQ-activated pathogenicity-related protein
VKTLPAERGTALDRYIASPDPVFGYRLMRTFTVRNSTAYLLQMTSQRWRSAREVNAPVWTHWLTVVVPRDVRTTIGALVISGGWNTDETPAGVSPFLAMLAERTRAVVGHVQTVPNQPLIFAGSRTPLYEDALVAYSWNKFLQTGDAAWPLHLPMTKSAVRAMDAMTGFCLSKRITVDRFIVGGASKRGWTTWLTAAADRRVVGIVPVVIDVLNVIESVEHAYRAYGSWPQALGAYEETGIMRWIGTPQLAALMEIEDPYNYRSRYTMPKLILNATGDQFFVPDSSQFYFSKLPSDKYLCYLANADHSLTGREKTASQTVLAFCNSIIDGAPRPKISWHYGDASVSVRAQPKPSLARLWYATNRHARDFRIETIGKAFNYHELKTDTDGTFRAAIPAPQNGWSAYFVALTFRGQNDPFTISTSVDIVPKRLPFRLPSRPMV